MEIKNVDKEYMSILNINSNITLNLNANLYFIDATSQNITITITDIAYDYEFYNLIRVDSSSNTVTIDLGNSTLITNESNFNLHPLSNVTLMSNNNLWIPINGYTKDR